MEERLRHDETMLELADEPVGCRPRTTWGLEGVLAPSLRGPPAFVDEDLHFPCSWLARLMNGNVLAAIEWSGHEMVLRPAFTISFM